MLLNLALSAMAAMAAMAGTVPAHRQLRITTADLGEQLQLEVADHGRDIDPADQARVFESFYTTKLHGLGPGLPIVRAIVESPEGCIELQPRAGGGSRFTVTLPRRLALAQAADASRVPVAAGAAV